MPTQPLTSLVRRLRSALDADALAATPDADLLARVRRRDPAAFEAVVRRHAPRVLAACRRVLADPADVDDAAQATFLVLMRNPRAVRNGRALGGWLAGVAHRVSLKALARRRRREQVEARARPRPETVADLSWREACAILHEELDRLPDRYRLPLILCYLDGLARDEAATRLGRSVNSVKKALDLGRDRLRKQLVRRGVTLSAGLLAAAAAPAGGEPAADVVAPALDGAVRPAVAALARSLGGGSRVRAVGVGLAATVLAMGLALGFPGGPRPAPVAGKDGPPVKAPPKEAPNAERIVVSGKVVDPDGKPVAGATLSLAGWEAVPGTGTEPKSLGTTGADGKFELAVAPDDLARFPQAQLVATAKKYGLALHLLTTAGAKDVTLSLAPDYPFVGYLMEGSKQPIAGARVRVVAVWLPDKDDAEAAVKKLQKVGWVAATGAEPAEPLTRRVSAWPGPLPGFAADVHTGKRGEFEITGLGLGRFAILLAERPGMVATQIVALHRSGPFVALPATPGETGRGSVVVSHANTWHLVASSRGVHGRVTDRLTGKPLADVTLRAGDDLAFVRTTTDAGGWYDFDGLGRPPTRLTAQPPADAPYFALTQAVRDLPADELPARLNFELTRGVWLSGRVVEARTNAPTAGARVIYVPARDNPAPSAVLVTGEPGHETAASVRSIAATGPDGRFRLPAAVGRGGLLVEAPRASYLAADVRDIQGEIADRAPPRELATGINEKVSPAAYAAVAAVNVDPDRDRQVTITLEPGVTPEIQFVGPDGKPLRGVVTDDRRLVPGGPPRAVPETVRITDRLSPERPAPLTVFHPETGLGIGYRPRSGDPGPWTVTLKPTTTITARLLDRAGKPLANVPVYVLAADGRAPLSPKQMEVRTDEAGRVKVSGIIGDADYLLWCLDLADQTGGSRSRPFRAGPGAEKDLGDLKAGR